LNKKFACMFCLMILALVASSLPLMASDLYNNLGTGTNVYNCCTGWTVGGSGTLGESFTAANEFMATASGSVSQINIGIGYVTGTNSFYVALDQVGGDGLPGSQIMRWDNLSSATTFGQCCGLVSITGISGVNLVSGDSYYLVIGPESLTGTTWEAWNLNSTGATGRDLFSNDGGSTWHDNGQQSLGAFEIVGGSSTTGTTPEPSSLLLFGTGMLGAVGVIRRKLNR
jgi:hypothetical protein